MAADKEFMYKCTLSDDVLHIAKTELNENAETRLLELKAFRDRLLQYPGLKARTDPIFLLRFLRVRKFDQERAFQLIINYYKMRQEKAHLLAGIKPSHVAPLYRALVLDMVPYPYRDRDGRAIIFSIPGKKEPGRFRSEDLYRMCYVNLSKTMEEEHMDIMGRTIIVDMKDYTLNHLRLSALTRNAITKDLIDRMPYRIKRMVFVNESLIMDVFMEIFTRVLTSKMLSKIVRVGTDWAKLHEFIDPANLPPEYGGTLPSNTMEDVAKKWADKMMADDNFLDEDNKYGFVDFTIGQETSRGQQDAITNMAGTFKQLNVE